MQVYPAVSSTCLVVHKVNSSIILFSSGISCAETKAVDIRVLGKWVVIPFL